MSLIKRYLERRSEELGYGGELTEEIMEKIQEQDTLRIDFKKEQQEIDDLCNELKAFSSSR